MGRNQLDTKLRTKESNGFQHLHVSQEKKNSTKPSLAIQAHLLLVAIHWTETLQLKVWLFAIAEKEDANAGR